MVLNKLTNLAAKKLCSIMDQICDECFDEPNLESIIEVLDIEYNNEMFSDGDNNIRCCILMKLIEQLELAFDCDTPIEVFEEFSNDTYGVDSTTNIQDFLTLIRSAHLDLYREILESFYDDFIDTMEYVAKTQADRVFNENSILKRIDSEIREKEQDYKDDIDRKAGRKSDTEIASEYDYGF